MITGITSNYMAMTVLAAAILSVSACGGGGDSSAPANNNNSNNTDTSTSTGFSSTMDSAWTMVNTAPAVNKVVFNGSKYIAVGNYGYIADSTDGTNWTVKDSGSAVDFADIAVNGNSAVAIPRENKGIYGVAVTSDGTSWKLVDGFENTDCQTIRSVTYDGTQFVGVFTGNKLCTSSDGNSWQLQSTRDALTAQNLTMNKIVAGSAKYVITVSGGSAGEIVSFDSINATTTNIGVLPYRDASTPGYVSNLIYGASNFVGINFGGIIYSSDGINWTTVSGAVVPANVVAISYSPANGFVGVSSSFPREVYTSADGISWNSTAAATLPSLQSDTQLATGLTKSVLFKGQGMLAYSSPDLADWTLDTTSVSPKGSIGAYLNYNATLYVANGSGLYRSIDAGASWEVTPDIFVGSVISLINDGTRFIASGTNGLSYSDDGVNWTKAFSYASSNAYAISASAKLGSTTYYFANSLTVLLSDDGIVFNAEDLQTNFGLGISGTFSQAVTNGSSDSVLVAITTGGSIVRYDGIDWTAQWAGAVLKDVVWTGTQFIAVGQSGTVLTSPDGQTWTSQASWLNANEITDVLVVGADLYATDAGGLVAKSPDGGVNWSISEEFNLSSIVINELAYDGTTIYGFGKNFVTQQLIAATTTDGGTIWSSGSALSTISGHVFYDAGNSRFVSYSGMESTDNGISWTAIGTTGQYPADASFSYVAARTKLQSMAYGKINFTSGAPNTYMAGQAYSEDGMNWSIKTDQPDYPGYTPQSGVYARTDGSLFGGGGKILVSSDGISYTDAVVAGMGANTNVSYLKYVNGQYIATVDNFNNKVGVYTSADGSNWTLETEVDLSVDQWAGQVSDIEYDGTRYIFVFDDVSDNVGSNRGTFIITSTDLKTLNLLETGIRTPMTDLILESSGYTLLGESGAIATRASY